MGSDAAPNAIEIPASRTAGRTAIGVFLLVVASFNAFIILVSLLFLTFGQGFRPIALLVGVVLTPLLDLRFWATLLLGYGAGQLLDGRTTVWRDGPFAVTGSKWFGLPGLRHRVNVDRLLRPAVTVDRYPRDATEEQWRPWFRTRVTLVDGERRLMSWGPGLTVAEGEALAERLRGLVEPARPADADKVSDRLASEAARS